MDSTETGGRLLGKAIAEGVTFVVALRNTEALVLLSLRRAGIRSLAAQAPDEHGLLEQHPRKGRVVSLHVHHTSTPF